MSLDISLLDSLQAHIAVTDEHGVIIATNRAWNNFATSNSTPGTTAGFHGNNYFDICARAAESGDVIAAQVLRGLHEVQFGLREHFSLEYPWHSPRQQRWFVLHICRRTDGQPGLVTLHEDISNRKAAETQLRTERDLNRRYLDVAAVMMVALDARGEVTLVNHKGCEVLGHAENEILGKNWFDHFLPAAIKAEIKQVFEQLILGNVAPVMHYENLVLTRDGSEKLIAWNNNYVQDDAGRIIGIISSGEDITERKAIETTLRIRDKAIATALSPIALADLDGKLTYVNQAFLADWGYASERQVLGKSATQFWLEPEKATEIIQQVLRNEHARGELTALRADGTQSGVELFASLVRNDFGAPVCMIGSFLDVTERKRTEQALRQSESRFRTIFDGSNDVIFLHDPESGCIRQVSAKVTELYGYTPEETLHLTIKDLSADGQSPYTQAAALNWMTRAMQGEHPIFEWLAKHKDGHLFWVEVSMRKADIDGTPHILVSVRDIRERKNMQQALLMEATSWTDAMDQFDDVIYLLDTQRHLVRANKAFYALARSSPEAVVGQHIASILHPQGEAIPCPVCQAQEALRDTVITLEADHPDNPGGKPIEIHVKILRDAAQVATGILMSLHDLTTGRQLEEKLRLMAAVFSNTHDGVMITDEPGNIVAVNRSFTQITGYSEADALGQSPRLLQSGRHDAVFYQAMWHDIVDKGCWQGEIWNRRKNGEIYPEWLTINAIPDSEGRRRNYVGVFSDITWLKQSEERLEHLAHHDALTNLPNRLLLHSRLEHAIEHARRYHTRLAVLFLDLDRFKHVNDSLGHQVGDELLKAITARLQQRLRTGDTLARLGGDEFIILMEKIAEPRDATIVAQAVIEALTQPFYLSAEVVYIGVSIGISLYPDDGSHAADLIRNADTAMYQAKSQGRSTCHFYTPALTSAANQRRILETSLRQALERNEFILHYQPVMQASSGKIIAVEALLRWQHPEAGMMSPADFIPLAEETGLIAPLGAWVLDQACAQVKQWQGLGLPDLGLAVNLSTRQFMQPELCQQVSETLTRHRFDPARLELEITESALMCPTCESETKLLTLKQQGIRIAIDDFGTGYSSLGYLRRFPIDTLKIDRSFVRDIPAIREDKEIAATIIAMAHNLSMTVIAEGVETEAQLRFLREQGCDFFQGYYFSRPQPADQFAGKFLAPVSTRPD